jgi:subtilisin-like proprotein convertase family protein
MNALSARTVGSRPLAVLRAVASAGLLASLGAQAAVLSYSFNNLNLAIPDGSSSGVSDTRTLAAVTGPILDVNVTLGIRPRDGGTVYNGDLYAALTHELTGYAVLLNRTGRREGSPLGYGDNGFNVTLDDEAANGDVHQYRLTLNGAHTAALQPAPAALTGAWAPDARLISPAQSTLTTPRTATLSTLDGLAVGGGWTLLVVDWETGGLASLDSWGLQITVVPEPGAIASVAALGLVGLAATRRWGRGKRPPSGSHL